MSFPKIACAALLLAACTKEAKDTSTANGANATPPTKAATPRNAAMEITRGVINPPASRVGGRRWQAAARRHAPGAP